MKKNSIKLITILFIFSCSTNTHTPVEYKNIVKVQRPTYEKDSSLIKSVLNRMRSLNIGPFTSKEAYDDNSQILIDTLIYSSSQLRMVVLFLVKNDAKKLLVKESDSPYYYDAYYLFCCRDSMFSPIKVYNRSSFGLVNFYSYDEIRSALHDYCFSRLYRESTVGEIHYNLDDIRIWKSNDFSWVIKKFRIRDKSGIVAYRPPIGRDLLSRP